MPLPSSPQGTAEVQTANPILRLLRVRRMDKHGCVMGQDRLTKPQSSGARGQGCGVEEVSTGMAAAPQEGGEWG